MPNENVFNWQITDNKAFWTPYIPCTINRANSIDVLCGNRVACQDMLQRVLK